MFYGSAPEFIVGIAHEEILCAFAGFQDFQTIFIDKFKASRSDIVVGVTYSGQFDETELLITFREDRQKVNAALFIETEWPKDRKIELLCGVAEQLIEAWLKIVFHEAEQR